MRFLLCAFLLTTSLQAEETSVEKLTAKVKKSVVVVHVSGRTGDAGGVGTGFVVGKGLIATNFHVVGQGRPITVETAEGKSHEVISVEAYDKKKDLALIRIKDTSVPPLPLGDSKRIREGQSIVVLGNPRGLKHSVVTGVVSSVRDVNGQKMIQLAIPVERGNSGGPVVDDQGRVLGVVTLKSLTQENIGFASLINDLKPLIKNPKSVPMSAWLTIGALDGDDWDPRLGANWRQRAGRILVDGSGSGFGGRSFCLSKRKLPELPYEVEVNVKLDNERGAAGLIFHADGGDRHYGFYPSGGKLRLTRFDGPTVYSWKILQNPASQHYRPGEWNRLKVRLEKRRIQCFVNDQLVIESRDDVYSKGQIGFAKFRNTEAEFKELRIAKKIEPRIIPADVSARIQKSLAMMKEIRRPTHDDLKKLGKEGDASLDVLRAEAKRLELKAKRIRQLAKRVHEHQVQVELSKALQGKKEGLDLVHAALLIARLDNEEIRAETYLQQMSRMEQKLKAKLPKDADEKTKLKTLNEYFVQDRGFHGSRSEYYHRSNSYLNEVLDDREGLPLTLAIVYLELGRRINLNVEGVALPGHFVVRHVPKKGKPTLIDVFEGAKIMTRQEAIEKVETISGLKFDEEYLKAVQNRDVIVRMLYNLMNVAEREQDFVGMLRYLDTLVHIDPESGGERAMRAAVRYRLDDIKGALEDADWLLEKKPAGLDLERVRSFRERLLESLK